ncbi:MAG TPA: PAS domain-containing protein, partial [Longimicrobium sp.]|nr:PAS domain-containing protein [Longimicrobium sp.]
MGSHRFEHDLTARLLPRLQELRVQAAAPTPRPSLATDLIEELQAAIAELRVAEEQLRSQQGQLEDAWLAAETASGWNRALFDGAADAVLLTDPDGLVRDANPAASDLLGVPGSSLRGTPLAVYIPADERMEFRARLRTLVHEPSPARFDLRLQPRMAVPVR